MFDDISYGVYIKPRPIECTISTDVGILNQIITSTPKFKVGVKVRLTENQDGLLPGSEGIVTESNNYSVRIKVTKVVGKCWNPNDWYVESSRVILVSTKDDTYGIDTKSTVAKFDEFNPFKELVTAVDFGSKPWIDPCEEEEEEDNWNDDEDYDEDDDW